MTTIDIAGGVWRVGTVGIFDCESPSRNYALLHKLVPVKRFGWPAYSGKQITDDLNT